MSAGVKAQQSRGVIQSINKCFKGDTWESSEDHYKQGKKGYRESERKRERNRFSVMVSVPHSDAIMI